MRLMHGSFSPLRAWTLLLAAALLGLAFATGAAPAPAASSARAQAPTNAAPAEPEPPKSVFIASPTAQQGKDPFFPDSVRTRKVPVLTPTTTNLPVVVVELDLKGISGTADRPLAIINNQTFATNEEAAVPTSSGSVRVRCLEIKADSVRVLINGQERTLRLRLR